MKNLIAEFLKNNPEWAKITLGNDGVCYYKHDSHEPFSKTEFLKDSANRIAMEEFEAKLNSFIEEKRLDTERWPITHVAVRYKDKIYSLPAPNRHHHVIRMIAEKENLKKVVGIYGENQGFLDSSGRYLTRKQALVSAQIFKQILDPSKIYANELFSENLW